MFFDEHPEFLATSRTANDLDRLNLRHEAIIADNSDVLQGARVLDLASHDGRWSYAALKAGAAHVTGVEARESLVTNARTTFEQLGADPSCYDFRQGDLFEALTRRDLKADVVMCLGFVYHTLRYPELLSGIRATGARHVIIDTEIAKGRPGPVILVSGEATDEDARAAEDDFSHAGRCLIGVPSMAALDAMLEVYGYRREKTFDWLALVQAHPGAQRVLTYAGGRRVTIRAVDAE